MTDTTVIAICNDTTILPAVVYIDIKPGPAGRGLRVVSPLLSDEAADMLRTVWWSAFDASRSTAGTADLVVTIEPDSFSSDGWRAAEPEALGLPLAVAVLQYLNPEWWVWAYTQGLIAVGRLSLSGRVTPARTAQLIANAKPMMNGMLLPRGSLLLPGTHGKQLDHLSELWEADQLPDLADVVLPCPAPSVDTAEYRLPLGHYAAMFSLGIELWMTSNRPVILIGRSGRTALAWRMAALLDSRPNPARVAVAYAMAGLQLPSGAPFRAPHHTVSVDAMIGTASRPGEIDLATCGTLYLDHSDGARFAAPVYAAVKAAGAAGSGAYRMFRLIVAVDTAEDHQRLVAEQPWLDRAICLTMPERPRTHGLRSEPLPSAAEFRRRVYGS